MFGQFMGCVCMQGSVHAAQVVEVAGKPHFAHHHQRPAFGYAQAFGGGTAIGTHQPTCAQLDAAVPARDHGDHLVITLAHDGCQDRPPGRAGWLAIVAGAVFATNAVGPAVMGCIAV